MQRPTCDKGVPEYLICASSHCTMCSKRERECRDYVMGMEIDPEDVCDLRMENPALDQDIRTEPDCGKDPKSRYYDHGGIEVLDIIRAKLTPEQYQGFCLGNAIKYTCRANHKGDYDRDLEKAEFYTREAR